MKMKITENNNPVIGVLGLQGDFNEHHDVLRKIGVPSVDVRLPRDLEGVSGLIIPGGESTTIGKLMTLYSLDDAIKRKYRDGMAIWGTCAGAILLAKEIVGNKQPRLGLMDISVKRNEYGRQIDSFEAMITVKGVGKIRGFFIRAPIIARLGKNVRALAFYEGNPVIVKEGNLLASTFHPELSGSCEVHEHFLGMTKKNQ